MVANVVLVEPPRLPRLAKPKLSVTFGATYLLGCLLILVPRLRSRSPARRFILPGNWKYLPGFR